MNPPPKAGNSAPDELDQSGLATVREVYEIKDELKEDLGALKEDIGVLKWTTRVGFPAVALYVTALKFVPADAPSKAPQKIGTVVAAVVNLVT